MRVRIVLGLLAVLFISACASGPARKIDWQASESSLAWPEPPEQPRVRFLRSIHGPSDFESTKNKSRLFTWLLGEDDEGIPLLNPYAVAADGAGKVWVTDTGTHLLYAFDLARQKVEYVQELDGRLLEYPTGLAFDKGHGRLFVADSLRDFVYVLNTDGDLLSTWKPPGGFKRPAGMTVDAKGLLYVTDALDGTVVVFDSDGRYLKKIGSKTSRNGFFSRPVNVAVAPSGEILIVDSMGFHVEIQTPDGELAGLIGRLGDSAGFFARPKGVAVDSKGHVYVSDSAFDNIQVFDLAGNLLMYFGAAGNADGFFNLPAGLFLDDGGRLYAADPYNQRVQLFQTIQYE